jgi:glutathione synthase/RimK-type ligase-like ATP-grasp enzyme
MVVGDWQQVINAIRNWGFGYISDYIPKVREVRVFVAQGRVVWVAEKTPADPTAHAWNVAQGGRFDNVRWSEWPINACVAAIRAARALNVDFAGVDVMMDAEGNPYVLEANSAPSQTSPYRQLCSAKAFKWMYYNGKAPIHYRTGALTWKELIHPALRN